MKRKNPGRRYLIELIGRTKRYISRRQPTLYLLTKNVLLTIQSLATRTSVQEIVFTRIYRAGGWGHDETVSGAGSTLANTENIRKHFPVLLEKYSVRSLLDIPCGDFHWMREVNFGTTKYLGGEIVEELVESNSRLFSAADRTFVHLDILSGALPPSDAVLCRDCLPHLPTKSIHRALYNIKNSGAQYLITSHYPDCTLNEDIPMGKFRPINLRLPPFLFPRPLTQIQDFDGIYADKCLAVWRIADISLRKS